MKKLFLLILTICFCTVMKAGINISYGISCSTLTSTSKEKDNEEKDNEEKVNEEKVSRTFIPSDLFAGVKVGTTHTVGLKVQTAIADMYTFNVKELNFHFNPDKIKYTLEISHSF